MSKIRVLIVDDSAAIRLLLRGKLSKDPELEVLEPAANGMIAVAMIQQSPPDIVTMDIEMPVMDGLTAVSEIRKTHPKLPIIMLSTLSQRAASITLEALGRGANDYVTKPANAGSAALAMERVRDELIPKIKRLCSVNRLLPATSSILERPAVSKAKFPSLASHSSQEVDILAIGISTGGPNALAEVLPRIPENFPVPIVIVQHMPPVFTKCLGERLSSQSAIPVQEAQPGQILSPGQAWIAPGDFHMTVHRKGVDVELLMNQDPQENSCRPAVDVLFRSVAEVYGPRVLAVILTGMGEDGLRGCEAIRTKGGRVFVQDESTSVVWGMPGVVAKAGLAEKILPLSCVASEMERAVKLGRAVCLV